MTMMILNKKQKHFLEKEKTRSCAPQGPPKEDLPTVSPDLLFASFGFFLNDVLLGGLMYFSPGEWSSSMLRSDLVVPTNPNSS